MAAPLKKYSLNWYIKVFKYSTLQAAECKLLKMANQLVFFRQVQKIRGKLIFGQLTRCRFRKRLFISSNLSMTKVKQTNMEMRDNRQKMTSLKSSYALLGCWKFKMVSQLSFWGKNCPKIIHKLGLQKTLQEMLGSSRYQKTWNQLCLLMEWRLTINNQKMESQKISTIKVFCGSHHLRQTIMKQQRD